MGDQQASENVRSSDAPAQETLSAGEIGDAGVDREAPFEVVVGEIPAADDPTVMEWTVRCSDSDHDLLGHFETRAEAEEAKAWHQESAHRG